MQKTSGVYEKAASATTIRDLIPALRFLYDTLGDAHGFFSHKGERIGTIYKRRTISSLSYKLKQPGSDKKIMEAIKWLVRLPYTLLYQKRTFRDGCITRNELVSKGIKEWH